MDSNQLRMRLQKLQEEAWALAREYLDQGNTQTYRTLVDITERIAGLLPHKPESASATNGTSGPKQPTIIPIFKVYKGKKYEAQLDLGRVNGNWSACVLYLGEWLTPSGAAHLITNTQVNGWRSFWRYNRTDGSEHTIEELKQSPTATHGS